MSRNILAGLIASGLPFTVVSSDRRQVIGGLGLCDGSFHWVAAPGCVNSPPLLRVRWAERPLSLLRTSIARWRSGPELERVSAQGMVVNGFSNHWVFRFVNLPWTTPRVLIVHDSPHRFSLKGQPPLTWALEKMSHYSHFIFCSERVAGEWMEFMEVPGTHYCAIPNCCREDEVHRVMENEKAAVRRQLGLPENRFVIVCPATIQHRKGQDLLVDILPVLQAAVPGFHLCLVGESLGAWGAALEMRIKESDYRNQIQLTGARRDALEFIYAADVMVLPSRSEAAPMVVLEAMALKTPVIAAAVGGVPEMIKHGISGLLFSVNNQYGLVECLAHLAKKPHVRAQLSKNASDKCWSNFSRNQMSARYATALRCFISQNRDPRFPSAPAELEKRLLSLRNSRSADY